MPPKGKQGKQRRQRYSKKNKGKTMEQVALSVFNKQAESKEAVVEFQNRRPPAAILTGDVLNAVIPDNRPNGALSNYFQLLPGIAQSVSGSAGRKYNTRIGNEICLKSIHIQGILNYALPFNAAATPQNSKIMVRFMVLSQKRSGNFTTAFTNISNRMLTNGTNASENTGTFNGVALDSIRGINRDVFTVHYEKKLYLDAPVTTPGTSGGQDLSLVPSLIKFVDKKIYFGGKSGLKLTFANSGATVPENFNPFICIGYSSVSTSNLAASDGLVNFAYNATAQYTDA